MSSYRQVTGKIKKPDGKAHIQYKPLPDGNYEQLFVWTPYPAEVEAWIRSMFERDSSMTIPGGRDYGYFGKWNFVPPDNKPEPVIYLDDIKEQPDQVDFQKSKNSGAIVMNPAVLRRVKLEWHPAVTPSRPTIPLGMITMQKWDFKGMTEVYSEHRNFIKLSNGNWYEPDAFFVYYEAVVAAEWNLPYLDLANVYKTLSAYERDGGLITSAAAALNEATFDLLTEAAEMPETVRMIRDGLSLFANKGKKMKKLVTEIANQSGSPSGMLKIGDKVANARLLYRYGILPIKYSIDDAKDLMKESFKREYTAGNSKKEVSIPPELEGFTFSGGYSQSHRAFFKRRLDPNDSFQQFQNVFSVNIPKTVWELTPWSLVVDWAVNVGDYLSAVNPMPSLEEAGCYSVRIGLNGKYTNKDGNILVVDLQNYDRTLINRISDSSIQYAPVMNNDRYLDAFAFSWQILRGKIRKLKK